MDTSPIEIKTSAGWYVLSAGVLAMVGGGIGFAVRPAFEWMLARFDGAPAPLQVAAEVPTSWAVPVLTGAGAVAGIALAHFVRTQGATLLIDSTGVQLTSAQRNEFHTADRIAAATMDGDELILLDALTAELMRAKVDNLHAGAIEKAFRAAGYEWLAPSTLRFQQWIDGHPDLPEALHRLLRARNRALADDKPGTVADLTDQLRDGGLAVRDRGGSQSYRLTKVS